MKMPAAEILFGGLGGMMVICSPQDALADRNNEIACSNPTALPLRKSEGFC
jgi:hypothetical protein